MTSKRVFLKENDNTWQSSLGQIGEVDIKSGWISGNSRIVLVITGDKAEEKDVLVDDARSWKSEIESAVRSYRVS